MRRSNASQETLEEISLKTVRSHLLEIDAHPSGTNIKQSGNLRIAHVGIQRRFDSLLPRVPDASLMGFLLSVGNLKTTALAYVCFAFHGQLSGVRTNRTPVALASYVMSGIALCA